MKDNTRRKKKRKKRRYCTDILWVRVKGQGLRRHIELFRNYVELKDTEMYIVVLCMCIYASCTFSVFYF